MLIAHSGECLTFPVWRAECAGLNRNTFRIHLLKVNIFQYVKCRSDFVHRIQLVQHPDSRIRCLSWMFMPHSCCSLKAKLNHTINVTQSLDNFDCNIRYLHRDWLIDNLNIKFHKNYIPAILIPTTRCRLSAHRSIISSFMTVFTYLGLKQVELMCELWMNNSSNDFSCLTPVESTLETPGKTCRDIRYKSSSWYTLYVWCMFEPLSPLCAINTSTKGLL